jgi:hypothetical protein
MKYHEAKDRAKRLKDFKITPGVDDVLGEKELAELRQIKINLGDDLTKGEGYHGVGRDSKAHSIRVGDVEEYEAQYDPNNDFAIFGVNNPTTGGIQSL